MKLLLKKAEKAYEGDFVLKGSDPKVRRHLAREALVLEGLRQEGKGVNSKRKNKALKRMVSSSAYAAEHPIKSKIPLLHRTGGRGEKALNKIKERREDL